MMFARIAGLTFFLIFAATAARAELALRAGEELTFRVAWGIFGNAGEIKIRAETETNDGKPFLVITTTTSTQGVLRRLFPFHAQAESIYDMTTERITVHTESSASNKKKTNLALEFDYQKSVMKFTDFMNSSKNKDVPIPPGSPNDLISSLVLTRNWDLKPGEKRDLNVFFEDDLYELTLHALQYEEVKTRLGKFNTLVYEPRMEKTPPKGMFKRGSAVHVWISQDGQRLPIRFEVEFKFGAGIATLIDYQPPTGAAGTAAATAQP
ncbi:MAG TPA: DUF3108 domain-containing protein [Opitutus sp.]|nr:DUF3108 domain-containing protein [Opitutus sp.]